MEPSVRRRCSSQRDQTAHDKAGDGFSQRKRSDRQGTCTVADDRQGTCQTDEKRRRTGMPGGGYTARCGAEEIPDAQDERMFRINVVIDQDRIAGLHIILLAVRPADEVGIVVECVDRRLGQQAGCCQQDTLGECNGDPSVQAPEDTEHGRTDGGRPGVDRRQAEGRKNGHPPVRHRLRSGRKRCACLPGIRICICRSIHLLYL